MKPEDKELLLKDLCARLPYRVLVHHPDYDEPECLDTVFTPDAWMEGGIMCTIDDHWDSPHDIRSCKPYLRPMSSMPEEEARDIAILHGYYETEILFVKVTEKYIDVTLDDGSICGTYTETIWYDEIISSLECFGYLNKNMFDYQGLIPKDLAISTEEFNPYKTL